MSGKNDIVQRLVTGMLTEDEKRGVSEEHKRWDRDHEPLEPRAVRFALTKEQKIAIYQDVKQRVVFGATPDDIGKAVVACIEEHLKDKENEAYGAEGSPAKTVGSFRRVE